MKRRTQGLLLVYLLTFLEAAFCLSLFSKSAFPREFTKSVERHLREDYGDRDVQVFREIMRNYKNEDTHLTPAEEEDLKAAMKKYAGSRFIQEYEALMDDNSKDSQKVLAKSMVNLIKQQFVKLKEIEAQYVTPNFDQYKQVAEMKPQLLDLNADTPCNTEAECKKLENMMNICTYVRGGADFAYDIFLVTTHVVTSMMAVLCACIFIGPVHVCALKNFPYTCKLPYPVFSTLFMATSAVWEVVKAATALCRVYGDLSVMSKMA
ncbi:conserved Plasmodium protein, unknown function [Plasmodium vivax]|uniref:Uncharacterized protein n=7 Tax=Plasmodium vivax TaxID=5855 RepID=A5K308_PLAVS|nr:hypothetical protein, conserved [Plasmodium vivax]KMZ79040.1 hypothetical protein PVIIG_05957 [Plasmodium vivax India VII]KMZ84991.1 hypothetical protein PVBG_01390 [Plasmodium vivax Brazil I]KMZ91451.1 hypothetical protein PVMG_00324 [Plasmodium vivax Mauritania I]KMZ97967.1 hypothetical protein PVNG_00305 [Plasmodium vivax North Korean]EDL45912.1 hypothetical protein, conserved [Plasmodium vivax]|eukprot:XP_001615639.1 hypothetical protein [Plasmodium vivax Sal-1]